MPSDYSLTVTVLPHLLALVHIPRSRLVEFSHQVVKQILSPSSPFLNITCNKLELSLFADHAILADFEPLARRDRRRYKRALSAHRSHTTRPRQLSFSIPEPVQVSYDTWNVLQLDSHNDRLDNAGARVRELSAPLAEAGISILYQSSYTSDFIFVKSSRLNEVLTRLAQAGFVGYSFDMTSQVPLHDFVVQDEEDAASVSVRRSFDGPHTELVLQRDSAPPVLHISSPPSDSDTVMPSGMSPAPRTSSFPCAADVQMLHQEIVCVGLSNAAVEVWASKIIKLIAYPELLAPSLSQSSAAPTDSFSPQKLPSLVDPPSITDEETPPRRLGVEIPLTPPQFSQFSSYSSPSASSSPSVDTPCSSSEEAYLSSELPSTPPSSGQASPRTSGLTSSRSYPELSELTMIPSNRHPLSRSNTVSGNLTLQLKQSKSSDNPVVPFFSFTRTSESSSLTTGRQVITALFPPNERHMVICGDELDPSMDDGDDNLSKDDRHELPLPSSTMKCLQIDLQRFGLDKHGLINKFSRVLDFGGINHMYSSTYKTANVLVSKGDALRAVSLLRSC